VAEGARLESVFTGNRNVGSNPTPSANICSQMFAAVRKPQINLLFANLESLRVCQNSPESSPDLWVRLWVGVRIPNERAWRTTYGASG
jgi:hypothetical protein